MRTSRLGLLVSALIAAFLVPLFSQSQAPAGRVFFRIIVLDSVDAAQRIVDQLNAGENFVALARKVSIDPTASNGGLVGPVSLADLRPELRAVLEGRAVGELSPIFRLPTGFAVLKVVPADEGPAPNTAVRSDAPMGTFTSALNASGAVKYVYDLSGYTEMALSLRQAGDTSNPFTLCQIRRQIMASARSLVDKALAAGSGSSSTTAIDRANAYFLRGQLYAYEGNMAPAIGAYEKAREIAVAEVPELRLQFEEALGIAYLHKAEIDNGMLHTPGHRCLLAQRPAQPFTKTEDVNRAITHFTRYLAEKPEELEVRWLLNLSHMFAGSYPDKVPAAQLIPPSAFASAEDVGRFVDVASDAGLNHYGPSGGVIVDDFDNDGRLDVVVSSIDSCEPMRFFRRTETGAFVEQGTKAGLSDQLGGLNIVQADYNNDGQLDILVLRGGWETAQRKSLLRNNGNGTFTDVTEASGLTAATGTQTAVWTDVDNDGLLDLFVGNENGPAQLFRNRGETFEDIAPKAGVDKRGFNKGVAAADYDNDGWMDLYVSNLGGTNFLYRNNHDLTFTELGQGSGVPGPGQGFPTWFFDYDNDGFQDLFVAPFVTSVDEVARAFLKMPRNGQTIKLYRNLRDGSFVDVTRPAGLDGVLMAWGAIFGDIDHDGFLDVYLGTGNPSYGALVPSALFRNKDGKTFVDVTTSSGTGELHKGHGVAFADLDNDGDEEIVFEVGGATPGDPHALRLFRNPGHRNDWITLKLIGVKSNRGAVGARVTVTVQNAAGTRAIHRTVGSGGSFGASPLQQHVGIGPSARRVDIEVWWPATNTRQRFADVGKNQFIQITEFAKDYERLNRPPLPLGGSKP